VKRILIQSLGLIAALVLVACAGGVTPQAAPEPFDSAQDKIDSTPTSLPVSLSRASAAALPEICECVLRFDHLNIEDGLSVSSVFKIFQDSRGFIWFGTEDGLNRYDGYNFKIFKPDPNNPASLSDRWISSIVEDQAGYLWIGTRQGGLNRYDPRNEKFTQFTHDDKRPDSLRDNHVNTLFIDHDNRLWVGTMHGLDLFDSNRGTFNHYLTFATQPNGSSGLNISVIHQDKSGQFWIGTLGNSLIKFDAQNNTFAAYPNSSDNQSTISSDYVTAIVEDFSSILWIGTRNGLNRFDKSTGRFDRFQKTTLNPETTLTDDQEPMPQGAEELPDRNITSNSVSSLLFDASGNLWVGTDQGLNRFKPGIGFIHYLNDPTYSKSLSKNEVTTLYEDRSGTIWIGTRAGGVNRYDRLHDQFAYYRNFLGAKNSIDNNVIISIFVDADGYVWLGSESGLTRFNIEANRAVNFTNNSQDPQSIGSNIVTSIAQDQHGALWIGTFNGLDLLDKEKSTFIHYRHDTANSGSLSSNFIYKVLVDSQNNLWVGTTAGLDRLDRQTGGFIHYAPKPEDPNGLSGGGVYTLTEDRDGYLWIGTFENGLNRLDPKTDLFTRYRFSPQNKNGITNDSISTIYQAANGKIWIGTIGGGLDLYLPETDSFKAYIEKDGLPNSVVYGILEDEAGNLWVSTNYGISRFNSQTGVFQNFDVGDGLQSNEFNSGAYAKGPDGRLYFGGIEGLTVFQPGEINENPYVPQVTLTSLTQDDQPLLTDTSVETLQAITLRYPQNSFEFNFAALSFDQPEKNQYAYYLDGFDTNWHFIGNKRDGRYTNIPGGQYTLLLKASNSDGIWNETPTRIKVTVIPPFWQTNGFRGLMVLGALALVTGGMGLRTKTIRDRNRALEKLVQDRTFALEERNREIEALYKADERILRNVSQNQVFQTLVDVAVDMLHADRCAIFVWDEKQNKVTPRINYGFSPDTLKILEFTQAEGIIGQVFRTGKPALVTDLGPVAIRYDVRAALKAEGIQSFAHLPIIVDQKVVAVLNLSFIKDMPFLEEDSLRLLSALINRAAISIANMQLFEQTKDLAVMEERNLLARDLHDSAKQKAFAALAQLGTARGILNGNGEIVAPHLNEAENLVSDVIQELTFLIQEIYPIALQEKGLATTLREYIFEWENRSDAKVNFSVRNDRRLPLDIEQAIYRVTQESLANVARHSQAHHVELSLVYNSDSIQLFISDDGQGFDMNTKPYGMGLRSIRERISSIHGSVQIQSAPGRGTRIIVQAAIKS